MEQVKYAVVVEAGKAFMEFHMSRRELSDWDIAWFDMIANEKFIRKMKLN